MKAIVIA